MLNKKHYMAIVYGNFVVTVSDLECPNTGTRIMTVWDPSGPPLSPTRPSSGRINNLNVTGEEKYTLRRQMG